MQVTTPTITAASLCLKRLLDTNLWIRSLEYHRESKADGERRKQCHAQRDYDYGQRTPARSGGRILQLQLGSSNPRTEVAVAGSHLAT